jgi:ubiquinone biosynthesis protein UbiJ
LFSESIFKPAENLINRGIEQSTDAAALCRTLDGGSMVVTVDMQPLRRPLILRFTAGQNRIYISGDSGNTADVEIAGTMMELSRLMFASSQRPLKEGRVRIHGDTDTAEQFRMLFLSARPNLEEELTDLVGDDTAPQVTAVIRNFRDFAVDSLRDATAHFSDYLKEDENHLPARAETEAFFDDVDELSNDVARIDARISRIRAALERHDHSED